MRYSLLLMTLLGTSLSAAPSYEIVNRFKTGGEGGFDYLRVDADARRLYVTRGNRVDVLDADTGAKVGTISGLNRAHGVAVATEFGHGFATSGGDNRVVMFDLKTLAPLKNIASTGKSPDGIEYDAGTKRVYAANHASGEVTVIAPDSGEVVGTVKFDGGKLEGLGFDGQGNGYVNAEDKSSVFVFDLKTLTPKATWSSAPGEGGTGLVVDGAHGRVFSACANGKLVVFAADTGKIVATPAIDEDPDALAFDPATGLLFVPCVGGTLNILHEDSPDSYSTVQTVQTKRGARTVAVDTAKGRAVVAAPDFGPAPTGESGRKRPPALPNTFEEIVVGQK